MFARTQISAKSSFTSTGCLPEAPEAFESCLSRAAQVHSPPKPGLTPEKTADEVVLLSAHGLLSAVDLLSFH